jgi:hypothetical protein
MIQPTMPPVPDFDPRPEHQGRVLDDLGGEPLAFSGFETEEPQPDFEERD